MDTAPARPATPDLVTDLASFAASIDAARLDAAVIEVGRHFSVEAIVCASPPGRGLRVDAQMPEHRHGINYRPTVSATGDGRYVAEGLLFHMPGRWRVHFERAGAP